MSTDTIFGFPVQVCDTLPHSGVRLVSDGKVLRLINVQDPHFKQESAMNKEDGKAKWSLQVRPVTAKDAEAELQRIFDDLQTRFHDQWDWLDAAFYLEVLMATIRDASTPEAAGRDGRVWGILYDDAAVLPEIFMGEGAEDAARATYKRRSDSWACHLVMSAPPSGEQITSKTAHHNA